MKVDSLDINTLKDKLDERGIVGDMRVYENNSYIMRFSPIALYTTVEECRILAKTLKEIVS